MDATNFGSMNVAEKLWDLANLTTGFAVAQSIATAFALAKGEFRFALRTKFDHWFGFIATFIFNVLYTVAIVWCRSRALDVQAGLDKSVWTTVTWGRGIAIWLFAVVTLLAFLGHLKNFQQDSAKKM